MIRENLILKNTYALDKYSDKIFVEGEMIILDPSGLFGMQAPGKGFTNFSPNIRNLFIRFNELEPKFTHNLKIKLQEFFSLQLEPNNLDLFSEKFTDNFRLFFVNNIKTHKMLELTYTFVKDKLPIKADSFSSFINKFAEYGLPLARIVDKNLDDSLNFYLNEKNLIEECFELIFDDIVTILPEYF